ncbi:hypothetical protein EGI22_17985 [Lacihabitans sp. LS3-19]|uniref:hypothetical protein n=1 Tax=Lacihabitans sp. LS3-19 TaxID=2487335 RepID=UPI0020CFA82D|nr:hypothetical protein [Lacihabitans sp. LS3-19]MCP9769799.1 hypothetical protein [Lacihabitans sp. LS3-19]
MVTEPREYFNTSFSEEKYRNLLADIEKDFPFALDFRVAESPIFVNKELKIKILDACNGIIDVIRKEDFLEKTQRAIPNNHLIPNENKRPNCLAIDFAVTENQDGEYEPQLIELQGFPSLFAYQSYLASKYKKHFDVQKGFSEFFNRLNTMTYMQEMQNFLLEDSHPKNVVLLEVAPEKQKTRLDFAISKKFWGIDAVCVSNIKKSGKDLYYEADGKKIGIERIFNRLIFDDLDRNYPDLKLNFDLKAEHSATWVSHPNWFYRVSKFSLPLFKSKYIPESSYLSDLKEIPEDLENYVLKPLFSFAGTGVKIDVTKKDLEEIKDPENFLLQKKIEYNPCIKDINGEKIKCEIRMLYIWPENASYPKLMTNLARLSRGKMIGVDFNKNFDWVGGSCAFFETN